MKNIYEIQVRAQCPVNPSDTDLYAFTLESETLIEVEKIVAFFKAYAGAKEQFQEALTQMCALRAIAICGMLCFGGTTRSS